jgi:hypothetical protein
VLFLGVSGNYRIGISGSEGTYRLGLGTGKGRLDPTLGTRGDGSIYGPTESLADMDLTGDETLTLDWETLRKYDANGELSTTFGTAGEVSISTVVGGGGGAVRVQPDGRIVVAARGPASPYPWLVARFEGDGTLDSSFGTHGIAEVSPGGHGLGLHASRNPVPAERRRPGRGRVPHGSPITSPEPSGMGSPHHGPGPQ